MAEFIIAAMAGIGAGAVVLAIGWQFTRREEGHIGDRLDPYARAVEPEPEFSSWLDAEIDQELTASEWRWGQLSELREVSEEDEEFTLNSDTASLREAILQRARSEFELDPLAAVEDLPIPDPWND